MPSHYKVTLPSVSSTELLQIIIQPKRQTQERVRPQEYAGFFFLKFMRCGHRLPKDACDYYSNEHLKCYAAADVAKEVPCYSWTRVKIYDDKCRSCKEGQDIDHAWKYGKGWAEASRFR